MDTFQAVWTPLFSYSHEKKSLVLNPLKFKLVTTSTLALQTSSQQSLLSIKATLNRPSAIRLLVEVVFSQSHLSMISIAQMHYTNWLLPCWHSRIILQDRPDEAVAQHKIPKLWEKHKSSCLKSHLSVKERRQTFTRTPCTGLLNRNLKLK